MFYVGLDVHSKLFVMCVLDDQGHVVRRDSVRQVDQLFARLSQLPPFAICYEASCDYGWLYDRLGQLAAQVVVGHPGGLRLIFRSKRKNDRVDAERLAKLLYLGEVPPVHVPSAEVRAWRELCNFRRRMVNKRVRVKNSLRALLRSLHIPAGGRAGVWTRQGIAWLKELPFSQLLSALKRDLLVQELEHLSESLQRVEQELRHFSRTNPAVALLQTIPGVGQRTAEAVVAFLDDPRRFARAKQVGAYFGLVPCQDQSASANRLGHITRDGAPVVRQLLVEAAWQAIRRSPTVKAHFERIHQNDPERRKTALVATAHYLLRVMWSLLREGTSWQETVLPSSPSPPHNAPPTTSGAAACLPGGPTAGRQARQVMPAAPPPGRTRRSRTAGSPTR